MEETKKEYPFPASRQTQRPSSQKGLHLLR